MMNETATTSEQASPMTKGVMASAYFVVFLVSEFGNGFVILSLQLVHEKCRRRRAMDEYVLNLAITDFVFTTLSLFNCVEYLMDEWTFGQFLCKLQGLLMEVTYTVSTLTLATISYTRYRAANATNPFKLLYDKPRGRWNIVLIWLTSLVTSLPLLYGYAVITKEGFHQCSNRNFNEVTRQTYYLFQAVVLFFIPLTIMLVSQQKITKILRWHSVLAGTEFLGNNERNDISSDDVSKKPTSVQRRRANFSTRAAVVERRITRLLTRVWIVFTCCWAPFILYRSFEYFTHVREKGKVWNQLWYLCQLSVLLNAAINPFLYYRITSRSVAAESKSAFRKLCCVFQDSSRVAATLGPRPTRDITQTL